MKRREFIKRGSVALVALSNGIGTGNIILNNKNENERFSVYAFLPDKKNIINECLNLFQNRISNNNFKNSLYNLNLDKILNKRFEIDNNYIFSKSFIDIKLTKLEEKIKGDIFVSDNSNLVLNPNKDFNNSLIKFRESIKQKQSYYLLSIEQKEKYVLSDLLFPKNKFITIENEKGLFDKISLTKNYFSLDVPGNIGITELEIMEGKVNIINSPCRHKLCKIMSQASGDKTIACVPNKVLIKIV